MKGAAFLAPEGRRSLREGHMDESPTTGPERATAGKLQPTRLLRVIQPSRDERQQRDRDRLLLMQLEGFDGPTWRNVVRPDVWFYALRVLPKLIETGAIFARRVDLCRQPADDLALPVGGISVDDAEDLASEVASGSVKFFHDQLKAGQWDITKDITFRTWFVNLCVLRFPGPYRHWLRDRRKLGELRPDLPDETGGESPTSVIYVVEFERYLSRIPDQYTKAMIVMDSQGYTDAEIADATRKTIKAVEGRLGRARREARERRNLEATLDRPKGSGSGVA